MENFPSKFFHCVYDRKKPYITKKRKKPALNIFLNLADSQQIYQFFCSDFKRSFKIWVEYESLSINQYKYYCKITNILENKRLPVCCLHRWDEKRLALKAPSTDPELTRSTNISRAILESTETICNTWQFFIRDNDKILYCCIQNSDASITKLLSGLSPLCIISNKLVLRIVSPRVWKTTFWKFLEY